MAKQRYKVNSKGRVKIVAEISADIAEKADIWLSFHEDSGKPWDKEWVSKLVEAALEKFFMGDKSEEES